MSEVKTVAWIDSQWFDGQWVVAGRNRTMYARSEETPGTIPLVLRSDYESVIARAEKAEQALAELVALHPIEKRARFLSNRAEWDAVQDRSIAAWAAARAIVESK